MTEPCVDGSLRLYATETDAEKRFHEAWDRNDAPAIAVASCEWTAASYAVKEHVLGSVERYSDFD